MVVSEDIKYVGVNDHITDLFEGQYSVPHGMAYNSYVILDEKIAIMDTVDIKFTNEWFMQLKQVLKNRQPDYLIIQHMEPDHSANIQQFMDEYPNTVIVGNANTFKMMDNFFEVKGERKIVQNKDKLLLGKHELTFIFAPMIHWPEVMVTYDATDKVLFSADGFGKFGANDFKEEWKDEARRYYIGIVGKYGTQVQNLLKQAANLDIQIICPLHGPVLKDNVNEVLNLYHIWSSYQIEKEGVLIAYTSVYGHTKEAVETLAQQLKEKGCKEVVLKDLAREDMSEVVAEAFSYGKIVLATTTYNADIFPYMKQFIHHLCERNFQNRMIGLIENGSWAAIANKVMMKMLENCKNLTFLSHSVTIHSAMKNETKEMLSLLADDLCK